MSLDYLEEKTGRAVTELATSSESVEVRVAHAFTLHLVLGIHDADNGGYLPKDLLHRLQEVERRLTTATDAGEEGVVMATARAMNDAEASEVAQEMVAIDAEVRVLCEEQSGR